MSFSSVSPKSGSSIQKSQSLTIVLKTSTAIESAQLWLGDSMIRVYGNSNGGSLSSDGKTWTVSIDASLLSSGRNSFLAQYWGEGDSGANELSFYYNAVTYTACGAPTVCRLSNTMSNGVSVTLSWSGATAGTSNAITGYEIQRSESSNGSTWGAWEALDITGATAYPVYPPETSGNYYRFRVRTQGKAGSTYYSAWKVSANTLRKGHDALAGFADTPLVVGETPVKALHMLELQERVNTLRSFYGLSAYAFSSIENDGLAGWTKHVSEIRAALDEVSASHEAWIVFSVNCPRADVIEQLRAVTLSL